MGLFLLYFITKCQHIPVGLLAEPWSFPKLQQTSLSGLMTILYLHPKRTFNIWLMSSPKQVLYVLWYPGYASVRPFLYFDHFNIFDLYVLRPLYFDLSTSTRVLRPLYFELFTLTRLLRHPHFLFVESYRSKYSFGRSKEVEVDLVEVRA